MAAIFEVISDLRSCLAAIFSVLPIVAGWSGKPWQKGQPRAGRFFCTRLRPSLVQRGFAGTSTACMMVGRQPAPREFHRREVPEFPP